MMFRVVTGSMEPTVPTGALLISKQTDVADVQLNDIICFRTQEAQISGKIVTHRVVEKLTGSDGSILLRTRGDANLVADSYFVDQDNMIGKVIWHTGKDSKVAGIFSFFTNGVGFLGCIVLPCLLLAGLILKECMGNIRKELQALKELENEAAQPSQGIDPLCGMTQEEYKELYEKLSAELMEELMSGAEMAKTE
jgi:signal peptidase